MNDLYSNSIPQNPSWSRGLLLQPQGLLFLLLCNAHLLREHLGHSFATQAFSKLARGRDRSFRNKEDSPVWDRSSNPSSGRWSWGKFPYCVRFLFPHKRERERERAFLQFKVGVRTHGDSLCNVLVKIHRTDAQGMRGAACVCDC